MTRLFRSKSCGLIGVTEFARAPPSPIPRDEDCKTTDEEEEEEPFEEGDSSKRFVTTPFISPHTDAGGSSGDNRQQFAIVDILVAALRKSLVTCSVEREEISSLDISCPTEVRHVSHVTFDRFNGFLGLPTELQPEIPRRVPSASVSVFGVSPKSMQCSYDERGNSVPTILLKMQRRLYAEGGLRAEGIFRINAENGQEEFARCQLNRGVVPLGIDVHCLAGLIKAWFRELPGGVLDCLTPEQVVHCNTEDDCTQLVKLLPSAEAALLDWAVNLMADVACHEEYNKMNARNIAMVFAPNMTQMADPLTALIHAVQVMNFLKTLILKTLREREELNPTLKTYLASSDSSSTSCDPYIANANHSKSSKQTSDVCIAQESNNAKSEITILEGPETQILDEVWNVQNKDEEEEDYDSISGGSTSSACKRGAVESGSRGEYDSGDWLSLRRGVRKLCRHPVFQFSKPAKKTRGLGVVNSREGGGEAWA